MKPDKFIELDEVQSLDGHNRGVVYKCFSQRNREEFLSVKVRTGPKAGQWDRLYRYTPLLDWSPDGRQVKCLECWRPFRRKTDEDFCRTCMPVQAKAKLEGTSRAELKDAIKRPWRFKEKVS